MHRSNTVLRVPGWSVASIAACALTVSQLAFCDVLAIGPVDGIDRRSSTVRILGQSYVLTPEATAELSIGQLLWIDATANAGAPALRAYILPEANAPGATQLYVSGAVTKVSANGTLTLGRLNVDFTNLLSEGPSSIAVGDFVGVFGTQPSSGGVLLADELQVVSGIVGTGTLGIVGTGTLGIVGTGTPQGIVGTGTLGIVGTGAPQGIVGTGTLGIVGTGTPQGIVGTGTLGIVGTGTVQGIVGTGIQ